MSAEMIFDELSDYHKALFKQWVSKVDFVRMGVKTTACLVTLENGFELVGTSACVNPADFSEELGKKYSLIHALNELDSYTGFYRQAVEE